MTHRFNYWKAITGMALAGAGASLAGLIGLNLTGQTSVLAAAGLLSLLVVLVASCWSPAAAS
jgi:hypothetical protein